MLTPEMAVQIGTTFGPIGGAAVVMAYFAMRAKRDDDDAVTRLVTQIGEMNARLIRVETILEERK